MERAKYIGKHTYNEWGRTMRELEYEYRGHRYTVEENLSQGNEPLSWQHHREQANIDSLIELKEKGQKKPDDWDGYTGTAQEAFDQWWKWVEGDAE